MKLVAPMPAFQLSHARIEANSGEIDPPAEFSSHLGELQQAFGELSAACTNT